MRTLIYLLTLVMGMFSANLVNAQPFFIDEEPEYVTITDTVQAKMAYLGFQKEYLQNDDGSWSKVIMVETGRMTPPANVSFTREEVKKLDEEGVVTRKDTLESLAVWSFRSPFLQAEASTVNTTYRESRGVVSSEITMGTVYGVSNNFALFFGFTLLCVILAWIFSEGWKALAITYGMLLLTALLGNLIPHEITFWGCIVLGTFAANFLDHESNKHSMRYIPYNLLGALGFLATYLLSRQTAEGGLGVFALMATLLSALAWKQFRQWQRLWKAPRLPHKT